MTSPIAESTVPAIATPRLSARPRLARTTPSTPNSRPSSTSGQAITPMNGMKENSRPRIPSTSAVTPKPLRGATAGAPTAGAAVRCCGTAARCAALGQGWAPAGACCCGIPPGSVRPKGGPPKGTSGLPS